LCQNGPSAPMHQESRDARAALANAGVRVEADNDVGREKIARYCSRPSISLERLSLPDDGRVAYRVRHSRRGETHRIMEPLEFMARLAALVPPPRRALTKYFSVLSSRSKWRQLIVPRIPCTSGQAHATPSAGCKHAHQPDTGSGGMSGSPGSSVHGQQPRGPVAGDARLPPAGRLTLAHGTSPGTSIPAARGSSSASARSQQPGSPQRTSAASTSLRSITSCGRRAWLRTTCRPTRRRDACGGCGTSCRRLSRVRAGSFGLR
jgi:hypothetical protein